MFTAPPTGSGNDKLVAHVIATRSTSRVVKDEDMSFPPTWKTDPTAQYGVGHQAEGRTIALHSLAVSPTYQRSGFGKKLMKSYIEYMRQNGQADRISILTYDRLLPYYQALGFTHYGKSASEYAGVAWHDLVRFLTPFHNILVQELTDFRHMNTRLMPDSCFRDWHDLSFGLHPRTAASTWD